MNVGMLLMHNNANQFKLKLGDSSTSKKNARTLENECTGFNTVLPEITAVKRSV